MTLVSQLQRQLECAYENLHWPHKMHRIAFVTLVQGGRGDVAAAAKLMKWLGHLIPTAQFEWVITEKDFPIEYFVPKDLEGRVHIRSEEEEPLEVDLLILGPKKSSWSLAEIAEKFHIITKGALFSFLENASPFDDPHILPERDLSDANMWKTLFSPHNPIAMGLTKGTGVFLNEKQVGTKLPPEVYLNQIQDGRLREDILSIEDPFSFNFGYAHRPYSHAKFIDLVALHENALSVVIALNQSSDYQKLSDRGFAETYFHEQRCTRLKSLGYSKIVVKGLEETIEFDLQQEGRSLYLIIRSFFAPLDMRSMQWAAKRIIATGDNSAAEAYEVGPDVYIYEDIANGGCKELFLEQQIALAGTIYAPLAKLLELAGKTRREFKPAEWTMLTHILKDEQLSEATKKFCKTITEKHSFVEVAQRAIKRSVWHAFSPSLAEFEARVLGEKWEISVLKERIENYIK